MIRLRGRRWLLLTCVAMALGGCVVASLIASLQRSNAQEHAAAKERWQARLLGHYRLVTDHSGGMQPCRQDVEVRDERVVAVFSNTCPRSAMTVANLFIEIERYLITIDGQCGPNGCACDGVIRVEAAYDAQLGYPLYMRVHINSDERWRYLEYWTNQLWGGGCALIGFVGPEIRVISVTPLP
jgi:hypothetical protein